MVLKLPYQSTQVNTFIKIEYAKPRGDGGGGRQRRVKRRAQEEAKGKDDDDERKRKEFRLDSMCR